MDNLILPVNQAIADKKFANGLIYYSQPKCEVTLTNDGYRIYRPANSNGTTQDTNPVWGGLKVNINDCYNLQKGHTYIIKFHVKGKSSNAPTTIGFSNRMGWGGGGLNPAPSNVSYRYTPANFNGEMECYYKFTINDDIYKTCTSSYSNFVAGQEYLSYKDFQFGFVYQDTGELGTDLYITNLRMYDITDSETKLNLTKQNINSCSMCEYGSNVNAQIYNDGDLQSNNFYEV